MGYLPIPCSFCPQPQLCLALPGRANKIFIPEGFELVVALYFSKDCSSPLRLSALNRQFIIPSIPFCLSHVAPVLFFLITQDHFPPLKSFHLLVELCFKRLSASTGKKIPLVGTFLSCTLVVSYPLALNTC